jgi:hypothetical protein
MDAIDQVILDRVAPVLEEGGFRHQGRVFWLQSAPRDRALVSVHASRLGPRQAEFFVDLAILPAVYRDWLSQRGKRHDDPIGLWTGPLHSPGRHDSAWLGHWSFDLDDHETGQQLTWRLRKMLPGLVRLLDRDNFLAFVRNPSTPESELHLRRDAAIALLLAENGDSVELDTLLAGLAAQGSHPDLVPYIRTRAAR